MTNKGIMTMPKWKSALLGLALFAAPTVTAAQTAAPATQPAPDRLAAAQRLIATLMPPEQRDAMAEQMISSMMANLMGGIKQSMGAKEHLAGSEVGAVLDRFIARQQELAILQLKDEMPGMIDAMSRAYARRFSVAQIDEMHVFFRTPTGQLYMREAMNIMTDPDVATWQRESMAKSMEKLPEELKRFTKELEEAVGRAAEEEEA